MAIKIKNREPLTREEKQIIKHRKVLNDICKECGREYHIPSQFCKECWADMKSTIKGE